MSLVLSRQGSSQVPSHILLMIHTLLIRQVQMPTGWAISDENDGRRIWEQSHFFCLLACLHFFLFFLSFLFFLFLPSFLPSVRQCTYLPVAWRLCALLTHLQHLTTASHHRSILSTLSLQPDKMPIY